MARRGKCLTNSFPYLGGGLSEDDPKLMIAHFFHKWAGLATDVPITKPKTPGIQYQGLGSQFRENQLIVFLIALIILTFHQQKGDMLAAYL